MTLSVLIAALALSGCLAAPVTPPAAPTVTVSRPTNAVTVTPLPATPVPTPVPPTAVPVPSGYRDATYEIEGIAIPLVNGQSEVNSAVGSAAKITSRIFGGETVADLNGDGQSDVIFILTQNQGGSGTFFYVVAALQTANGFKGTQGVLLGDRIATPRITLNKSSEIEVTYLERKAGEPFTATPSVAMTKTLKIMNGKLTEAQAAGFNLTGRTWTWVRTQMNDGTVTTPKKVEAFTITFNADGSVLGTTDCNRFFGKYSLDGNKVTFGPLASTKMACSGSQESVFMKFLGEIDSYLLNEKEQTLVLLVKFDSGSVIFK